MLLIPEDFNIGRDEARNDIAKGHIRFHFAARSEWGRELEETMRSRFGIELVWLTCFTSESKESREQGYNETVEKHIDNLWGRGTISSLIAKALDRRQQQYDEYVVRRDDMQKESTLD